MRIFFGAGQLYALPVSNSGGAFSSSPVWFATLQDVDITIDATIKELRGQYQFPDDTAISDKKITWKAGFEMLLSQPYQEQTAGIPNYLDLYACKAGKLTVPLKRADYTCDKCHPVRT